MYGHGIYKWNNGEIDYEEWEDGAKNEFILVWKLILAFNIIYS